MDRLTINSIVLKFMLVSRECTIFTPLNTYTQFPVNRARIQRKEEKEAILFALSALIPPFLDKLSDFSIPLFCLDLFSF